MIPLFLLFPVTFLVAFGFEGQGRDLGALLILTVVTLALMMSFKKCFCAEACKVITDV